MSHQPVGAPYKEEPTSEAASHPGHPHHHQPHAQQSHNQPHPSANQHQHPHARPALPQHQQQQQHGQHPPTAYASPHPQQQQQQQQHQQHQSPFAQTSASLPPQHHPQQDIPYFAAHPSSYGGTPTSGASYPPQVADGSDLMAAHTMNRPTYPPIYHTPQSNSPASVASPTAPDHRSVYQQQPMPNPMYGYPQPYAQMPQGPPYGNQPAHQHMLMSHQQNPTMTPPQPQQHHHVAPTQQQQPGAKMPPQQQPQQPQQQQLQQPQPQPQQQQQQQQLQQPQQQQQHTLQKGPPAATGVMGGKQQPQQQTNAIGTTINPNAAPGPIPATTPLVVRQDQNGVQWIMFEYSRDRVKMEYTIRCDVESVNVDSLSHEFKTENCVYPRACCSKEQYRGNRLVYETECNAVGWALAELNPPLRGKRGLIQRAVDSWRNSNQDPRLRSRRVRRMAKLNNRKQSAQAVQTAVAAHMSATASPVVQALPSSTGVGPGVGVGVGGVGVGVGGVGVGVGGVGVGLGLKGPTANLIPTTGAQLQHHHHQPGGDPAAPASNGEENGEMSTMLHHHTAQPAFQGQMNSGHNSRSTSGHLSPAIGHEDFGNAQNHHQQNGPTSGSEIRPRHVFHGYPTSYPTENVAGASMPPNMHDGMDPMGPATSAPNAVTAATPPASQTSLFGDIPEHKRRKFILVDDPHRGSRVRVRVMLDQVHMQEIPDSYRRSNSVYPRSFISSQQGLDSNETEIHTQVTVPMLDGSSMTVDTPPPSNSKRKKEHDLNELGYRMSWSQSRVFAGRTMFLQRALDAYRNKMRSSMMAYHGTNVITSAPHLETRVGKRKWMERSRRTRGA